MGVNFYFSRGKKSIALNRHLTRVGGKVSVVLRGRDCLLTLRFRRPLQLTNLTQQLLLPGTLHHYVNLQTLPALSQERLQEPVLIRSMASLRILNPKEELLGGGERCRDFFFFFSPGKNEAREILFT